MFLETEVIENQKQQFSVLKNPPSKLKITERDLSILDFLLNMKFAGFEELYEKFFPKAENLFWGYSHWSRDRIAKLREHGLVESFQFPGSQKRYILATDKGRRNLIRERPLCNPPWALKKPQFIHFEHDLTVLKVRLALEKANRISNWISERFLKIEFGDNRENSIEKHNIPDGIYEDPRGKKIALEVEMSHKARKKYQEKIKFLVSMIRNKKFKHFEFDEVHFICKSKAVTLTLKEETKIYSNLFTIQTLEEFFSESILQNKKNQSQSIPRIQINCSRKHLQFPELSKIVGSTNAS